MNLSEDDRLRVEQWATGHPEISKIFLYGSRARGDNRPDSDIDLAIVLAPSSGSEDPLADWMDWLERFKRGPDLALSHELHLEWYAEGAGLELVGPAVERDGVLLFSR